MTVAIDAANPSTTRGGELISLSFASTVDCALAHRRAVGETFLTDSVRLDDGDVVIAFQIPRAHLLWGDHAPGKHDEFAVAEAARQAAFVTFHEHLGIPLGLPFSMQRWDLEVLDEGALTDRGTPLQGTIRYRATTQLSRPDHGRIGLSGVVDVDGVAVMTVVSDVAVAPREDYLALRDYQRATRVSGGHAGGWDAAATPQLQPVRPAAVGRHDARNCVVAASPGGRHDLYLLAIDVEHPAFFDHEYDHVPGPLLNEGVRQAAVVTACAEGALASANAAVESMAMSFTDFAEFGADVEIGVTVAEGDGDRVAVYVAIRQFDTEIATGRMTLRTNAAGEIARCA